MTSRNTAVPSLRANIAWTAVGNAFLALSNWGIIVSIAKFQSPEALGHYALALAICTPVFVFAGLNLRVVQATDAQSEFSLKDYYSLRVITIGLGLFFLAGLCAVSDYGTDLTVVIVLLGFAKAVESLSDISYGMFQRQEDMRRIALSMIYRGTLALVVSLLALRWSGRLPVVVASLFAAWFGVLVFHDLPHTFRANRTADDLPEGPECASAEHRLWGRGTKVGKLFATAFPMGILVAVISFNDNLPRFYISSSLGDWELGIYAALAQLMMAGNLLSNAVGHAAMPRMARHYAVGERSSVAVLLRRITALGCGVAVVLILAVSMAGTQLLTVIYTEEYGAFATVLVVLVGAASLNFVANILGSAIAAMRRFALPVPVHVLNTGVILVTMPVILRKYGLMGAAMVSVLTSGVTVLVFLFIVQRLLRSRAQ